MLLWPVCICGNVGRAGEDGGSHVGCYCPPRPDLLSAASAWLPDRLAEVQHGTQHHLLVLLQSDVLLSFVFVSLVMALLFFC